MTPFTTYYKSKYYPIGAKQVGAQDPNKSAEAASAFKKIVDVTAAQAEATRQATNDQLKLNEGMAVSQKLYQDMADDVLKLAKDYTSLHEIEKSYIKTFKVGTTELISRRVAYQKIQENLKLTDAQMRQYQSSMEKFAPMFGKVFKKMADGTAGATVEQEAYMKAQLASYDYLSQNTSLSADAQAKFNLFAAGSNTTLQQQVAIYDDIAGKFGDNIDKSYVFDSVVSEIAETSADIRAQYKKYPAELARGVMMAKKLGTNMAEVHGIGKSLLNIEESVGKELEYQLLSGKRLVDNNGKSLTQKYREATLSGKYVDQQKALYDILDSQEETMEGQNYLSKEALAATMNISAERLQQLYDQKKLTEQIEKMGGDKLKIDLSKITDANVEEAAAQFGKDSQLVQKLKDLRETNDRNRTPVDQIADYMKSFAEGQLTVKLAKDQMDPAYLKLVKQGADNQMKKPTELLKDEKLNEIIGSGQIEAKVLKYQKTFLETYISTFPYSKAALGTITGVVDKILQNVEAAQIETTNTKTGGGTVATNEQDAVVGINDGIIKFHDRDRLTVVASPYGSMNEKVADKITNPTNTTMASSIDTNSIVNAIKAGLSNISMTVNIDPMAIHKEIQFKIG